MKILIIIALFLGCFNAEARIERSRAAVAAFKHSHSCPSNGKRYGPCPGWEIDHIIPLKCKGADTTANMQWLTVKAHKAKTRRENAWCRK